MAVYRMEETFQNDSRKAVAMITQEEIIMGKPTIRMPEEMFIELVLRDKSYIIIDEATANAIHMLDVNIEDATHPAVSHGVNGSSCIVIENDPDSVGWAGTKLGEVESAGAKGYRLWRRQEWKHVGNLARERAIRRERLAAEADARQAAKLKDLKQRCRDVGITEENIALMFDNMSEKDIRKMTGL